MDNIEERVKMLVSKNIDYEFEEFGESKLLLIKELDEEKPSKSFLKKMLGI